MRRRDVRREVVFDGGRDYRVVGVEVAVFEMVAILAMLHSRAGRFGVRAALDRRLIRFPTRCCKTRRPSTRPAHDCWGAVVEIVQTRGRPVPLPSR